MRTAALLVLCLFAGMGAGWAVNAMAGKEPTPMMQFTIKEAVTVKATDGKSDVALTLHVGTVVYVAAVEDKRKVIPVTY